MAEKGKNILKYDRGEKSKKFLFAIYANTESLLEKIDTCQNNPEKSLTMKVHKDTSCGYSLFTHCSFDSNKNKHDYLRGENCKKNIFKEHTKNVKFEINIITQKKCRGPSHIISNLRYKIPK